MNTLADIPLRRRQTDAWLDLYRIARAMDARAAVLLRELDLAITPPQASVLMALFQAKEPLSSRALADALGRTEATMCRLIEKLERDAWISRSPCPTDARKRLVTPTPKAYDALPRFIQCSNTLLDEAWAGLPRDDIEQLTTLVRRIRENLVSKTGSRKRGQTARC